MDQVRNFTQANRSFIVNIIYIVAAIVLVFYLVNWYFSDDEKDIVVLKNKMSASAAKGKAYTVVKKNETKGRATNEYTISAWIYINSYNTSAKPQGVLAFFDNAATSGDIHSNLFIGLHPEQPKMIIRAGNIKSETTQDPHTVYTNSESAPAPTSSSYTFKAENSLETGDNKPCDVMDIDIQRWICVAVSVNGRIMDVYLDGKLARSCIMPNVQNLSDKGEQSILLGPSSTTFNGHISGVMFSNYAVTPDVIYARYQAGPYFSSSFLDYLVDKLGVRITYTDAAGDAGNTSILESLGIKA